MEPDEDLNPDKDDLPLRANTNHILVRHYVLDLTVHFERKVISGSIVLFLEPQPGPEAEDGPGPGAETVDDGGSREVEDDASPLRGTSSGDFTLLLDCCDLDVLKVEEVDVTSVSSTVSGLLPPAAFIQSLLLSPSGRWQQQHQLLLQCSRAPAAQGGASGSLHFQSDRWSLQVRKDGVTSPQDFPRALRICYETRPKGGSVRWTRDQDHRFCVYTAGSPINNRALFPCQEPPVAMATWQATVRAPGDCVVLMSGEEPAVPTQDADTRFLVWSYYVTMAMPASTFTLAVGHWHRVTAELPLTSETRATSKRCDLQSGPGSSVCGETGSPLQAGSSGDTTIRCALWESPHEDELLSDYSAAVDDGISCSHGDYPCRFREQSARSQRVVPHRVFSPVCLMHGAQLILNLLPRCLAAAHAVLGVHPFPRLDVLIVPAGFSSLGMASPHIMFLSQSVLSAGSGSGSGSGSWSLCGSRLCHEISHSWFGLLIGARDWTEEWISEGFATYLEDIIWARAQQLSAQEAADQSDLQALLRWRRLSDELRNSEEALQILRPNLENTGQVSESGSSTVKHALNPDKAFMQVHYLKGYFLLRFLASRVGERFVSFFRLFVEKHHGQLVLSQDFLQMLLTTFPDVERAGVTLTAVYADWLDRPGIPKWLKERSAVWSQTRLVEEVKAEVVKWILLSQSRQTKGRKRKRTEPKVNYREVTSEQLVMLLELLLEEEQLSAAAMQSLQKTYNLRNQDAEVQHRWCELVIKHGYTQAYRDVEHFLLHHQAMGVYLYGELMLQEDSEQQALARRCFSLVQEEMDQSARRVVEEMVL